MDKIPQGSENPKPVKSHKGTISAAITGKGVHDSRELENIFEKCRQSPDKMLKLVRAFCETYLMDQ